MNHTTTTNEIEQVRLRIVPITYQDAAAFVEMWHRHHKAPKYTIFSLAVADDDDVLRGVAMIGRPVARHYADGMTLEVNRSATDGTPNANSCLYGAAWKAAKALGYSRLITYTQDGETGSSLKGAGWKIVAHRPARAGWSTPSRPRDDNAPVGIARTLWEAV